MRKSQAGVSMIETMLAIVAGVILIAGSAALAVKLRTEAKVATAINAVNEIQIGMRELFGAAGQGYPAGLDVAQYLREHQRAPALPVNAAGCFELDTTIDLCPSVQDDGGGRGMGYTLTYVQKVGGRRAEICERVVASMKPQLLDIRAGVLEPCDVGGRFFVGAVWCGFWQPLCANPVTIEATLR